MSKTAPLNLANLSTLQITSPENYILKKIFDKIRDANWHDYEFKFRFKAQKNEFGRGFELRDLQIIEVEAPKRLLGFESPREIAQTNRENFMARIKETARKGGLKGGPKSGRTRARKAAANAD